MKKIIRELFENDIVTLGQKKKQVSENNKSKIALKKEMLDCDIYAVSSKTA